LLSGHKGITHLHECLRIITSPLLEVSALVKVSEPCKRWSQRYAVIDPAIIPISIKNEGLPPVNIIEYPLCFCRRVFRFDVFSYPCNEMVLEAAFDKLMQ